MPHVNDKATFKQCMDLLGGPRQLHLAARINGRRLLDASVSGQRLFQAMLLKCLVSPRRTHVWDEMGGRSFYDLESYFNWVSPQPDRLIIETSTAGRVAGYLVPYARSLQDDSHECSGIAGLRLDSIARGTIRLRHLATGGLLELRDARQRSERTLQEDFRTELRWHRETDTHVHGRAACWDHPELVPAELSFSDFWQPRADTRLLSAIMARISLLWKTCWKEVHLQAIQSNGTNRLIWEDGPSTEEFAELLTGKAVGIPGAAFIRTENNYHRGLLMLGQARVQLAGPSQSGITTLAATRAPMLRRGLRRQRSRPSEKPVEASPIDRRSSHRRTLTGEDTQAASRYLTRMPAQGSAIPEADPAQAALEVRYALAWGRPMYEAWPIMRSGSQPTGVNNGEEKQYPPLGIIWVNPLADELRLEIHLDMLPNMIHSVLPIGCADGVEDEEDGEIWGIAGLRTEVHAESVVLRRLGMPGKIRIMVDRAQWERAVEIALRGIPIENVLWQRHPEQWTQQETRFEAEHGWVRDFGAGNELISGILRRIHVLNGPNTECWHLWADNQLKIYWRGGVPHQTVVDRLLDPDANLDLKHGRFSSCQCLDEDGKETGTCHLVRLEHPSGLELLLKRNP